MITMEYRCGYCNKLLQGTDKIYFRHVGKDYFIPYCSQEHKDKDNDSLANKLLIVKG